MPPTTASVNRIRNRVDKFLTQRCTIQSLVVQTGSMKTAPIWQTARDNVPCRLIQLGQGERPESELLSGQEIITDYYILTLPYDATINPNFRILADGLVYQIVRIEDNLTDSAFIQAIVSRQRGQKS